MVSSCGRPTGARPRSIVSIPFIAGQWSLPAACDGGAPRVPRVSIPFIAGQWSLPSSSSATADLISGFNPLHCGAVVSSESGFLDVALPLQFQSPSLRGSGLFPTRSMGFGRRSVCVSIPFIAGQWSLRFPGASRPLTGAVSIPFIAGQWSLRVPGAVRRGAGAGFQSPSLRGSGLFGASPRVSSSPRCVSITFIAGQWSLLIKLAAGWDGSPKFQSPSLRGSGLFAERRAGRFRADLAFQSPSLRGSGLFRGPFGVPRFRRAGFNPLHCGAVVSSGWDGSPFGLRSPKFQSPSLRGSGLFRMGRQPFRAQVPEFQSPSLRGSGLFSPPYRPSAEHTGVSIPFIAGQWSLLCTPASPHGGGGMFQSPSLRGSGLFNASPPPRERVGAGFNPLHCGAVVSSASGSRTSLSRWPGFNPLHCGAVVSSFLSARSPQGGGQVSIPFIAGQWSLPELVEAAQQRLLYVSIPFIAGQWSLLGGIGCGHYLRLRFQSPSLRGSGLFLSPLTPNTL